MPFCSFSYPWTGLHAEKVDPLLRIFFEHECDKSAAVWGDLAVRAKLKLLINNFMGCLLGRFRNEGEKSHHHLEENDSTGPHVSCESIGIFLLV